MSEYELIIMMSHIKMTFYISSIIVCEETRLEMITEIMHHAIYQVIRKCYDLKCASLHQLVKEHENNILTLHKSICSKYEIKSKRHSYLLAATISVRIFTDFSTFPSNLKASKLANATSPMTVISTFVTCPPFMPMFSNSSCK